MFLNYILVIFLIIAAILTLCHSDKTTFFIEAFIVLCATIGIIFFYTDNVKNFTKEYVNVTNAQSCTETTYIPVKLIVKKVKTFAENNITTGLVILENDNAVDLNDIQEIYIDENSSENYFLEKENGVKALVLCDKDTVQFVQEIKENNIKNNIDTKEISLEELQRIY